MGALCVVDETADGEFLACILSNNHVSASSNLGKSIDDPSDAGEDNSDVIVHPGQADPGPYHQIARLYRYVPLDFGGGGNTVDASLSYAVPNLVSAKHRFDVENDFTIEPEPIEAVLGMNVKKIGRTTGFTTGVVTDVSGETTVGYGPGQFAHFVNQIAIQGDAGPFSLAGDSGSLVVDGDTNRPTGLLFSGGGNITYANPIMEVMSALTISRFLPAPGYVISDNQG
jgi:hypothetical protein